MSSPIDRDKKILEYLQKQGHASIQELTEAFSVSNMTIHRELNKLADAGLIQKKHGGVRLNEKPSSSADKDGCAMCHSPISSRTVFIARLKNDEQKRFCCAHCGLMSECLQSKGCQPLTADYLRGHTLSANQAVYLLDCELVVCCAPSVLSFASRQDAEKFQKGFGGKLANMEEAILYLHKNTAAH